MPRRAFRTAASLAAITIGAIALSACFEVENGPAFSGGDEVQGLPDTLYTIGRIDPSEGPGVIPVPASDQQTWHVRRAINGSYLMTEETDASDATMIRTRRIRRSRDYVIEYNTDFESYWLGILSITGQRSNIQYNFCIDLNWDDDDIAERARNQRVQVDDESFVGVTFTDDNPDDLFDFMAGLWADSELEEWTCTVLSATPPTNSQPNRPTKY